MSWMMFIQHNWTHISTEEYLKIKEKKSNSKSNTKDVADKKVDKVVKSKKK